jgi:Ca2+/Na+ antiporter
MCCCVVVFCFCFFVVVVVVFRETKTANTHTETDIEREAQQAGSSKAASGGHNNFLAVLYITLYMYHPFLLSLLRL